MIEMADGARYARSPRARRSRERLPWFILHGGPGVPDYLAPTADPIDELRIDELFVDAEVVHQIADPLPSPAARAMTTLPRYS